MLDVVGFMLKNTARQKRIRWAGHVEHKGGKRIACRVPEGNEATWKTYAWMDNIQIDLEEMWQDDGWIHLATTGKKWRAVLNSASRI
jgi:hypothetical protein